MKKILLTILILLLPIICEAENITKDSKIVIDGINTSKLTDGKENSYLTIESNKTISITSEENIAGIYIIYELSAKVGIIETYDKEEIIGNNGFLHEYIDVYKKFGSTKEITLKYNEIVKIGEIYILSEGNLPEFVEIWDNPLEKADLLLLSTHSDDEQLFFAGLMPHYVAKGAKVQVVYFTNHYDNPKRLHEQIHGLYAVGIRNYPIIGFIKDAWSESLNGALSNLKRSGYTVDDAIKFEVEMIRRFQPLVVVGHDELGEYSHGQHILNTYILEKAITLTNDKDYDEESINAYGLWDVPKTYLHLYKENKIIMNYDIPLDYFDGLTAYEVSIIGYSKHLSQQYTWFTKWLTGINDKGVGTAYTKASQITKYSPCEFGLYRSLVGDDTLKNDMFENLTIRADEVEKTDIKDVEEYVQKDESPVNIINNTIYYYVAAGIILISIILIIIKKQKKS